MNWNNIWMNLNDIPTINYSIGAATARVARVQSPDPATFFENLTWNPPKIMMY